MANSKRSSIRVGIGGWVFEPWRGTFYPDGLAHSRELEYAARKLTSIEINGTFYRTQSAESFARWHDETPEDFVFTLKGPRFATNRKTLAEAGPSIERFFASGVLKLKKKLGPINWQFMPTKKFDPDDFAAFLQLLPRAIDGAKLRHAVEVRHASFVCPEFIALARNYGVAVVVSDKENVPNIGDITAPFVYARLQRTGDAKTGYAPGDLDAWAKRARAWAEGGVPGDLETVAPPTKGKSAPRDVFVFMIGGNKVRNPAAAMALIERLG